jgi:hypothetical protein
VVGPDLSCAADGAGTAQDGVMRAADPERCAEEVIQPGQPALFEA